MGFEEREARGMVDATRPHDYEVAAQERAEAVREASVEYVRLVA